MSEKNLTAEVKEINAKARREYAGTGTLRQTG
jgi:hypothetical protein